MLNGGYAYRERILEGGESVLAHFLRCHPHSSETVWRRRLEAGEVELDGHVPAADTALERGQWLQWMRPPWEEPPAPEGCDILHEDPWLVAALKPRGLPTLPGGGFLQQTLLARVREHYPEADPMHRLGRETSGIVLFARTHAAAAAMQTAWRAHDVRKVYRALAQGLASEESYDITTPIGPVPHPLLGTLHAASPRGKASHSHAQVLERREDTTLFEVEIFTGRPHQIRIHLASMGYPLVGDPLYVSGGGPNPNGLAVPGDGGYFLHAERLSFTHPHSGEVMELHARAPEELRMRGEV